jgi:ADP-ribose pyrophosphatase
VKLTQTHTVWQGSSWRLLAHTLTAPDGTEIEKGVIQHPGAVALIPVQDASTGSAPEILMIRQYRLAIDQTILELPAGTRHWKEDWLTCAQRELREEIGFRADQFTFLGEIWPAPGFSNEQLRLYLASGLHPDPLPGDIDEEITLHPLPLPDLVRMAKNGQIQDAKSIIGILRAAEHLA